MNNIQSHNTRQTSTQAPLVLNEGQMIHGKIQQLYPGQLAEVQVGHHKMVAKLEVPMRAGDSYYFQVTSVQPEVQLKIIAGPTSAQTDASQQLQNLIQAMQLPKSPEMSSLLEFVLEQKIPISRENILQAVQLLQTMPAGSQQDTLIAIQKMLDLKLPLTENLFQSIVGVETKAGLHATMQSLTSALQNDPSIPAHMRENILQVLAQIRNPLAMSTSTAILGESLNVLLDSEQNAEVRFSALQLLKEAAILPRQASLPNLQQTLAESVARRIGFSQALQGNLSPQQLASLTQFVSGLASLTSSQKEGLVMTARTEGMQSFSQAVVQMLGENVAKNPMQSTTQPANQNQASVQAQNQGQSGLMNQLPNQTAQTLLSLLNQGEMQQESNKMMTLLQNAEQSNRAIAQQLVQVAESTVSTTIDGKVMKEAMQTIFQSLGMNYESALLGKEAQPERLMQALKPQLLAMLNDPAISANAREIAEQLVVRLNGSPLMSTENGVNHQLVMQLPLEFFGKKIDATLQWSGRLKEDDKIDADFARILFYLNLHSLKETVVDMQVQNRVVTITVFNEDPALQALGQPLQSQLKEGLSSIGYTLSGVFFKGFVSEEVEHRSVKTKESFEGGLDFRI